MTENQTIVLTGDRPTGRLHLGHYVGSIKNRIAFQNTAKQSFYMIADVQALTDNADNPEKVRNHVLEVLLDNLACGLDPEKTICYVQSAIPEIAELTVFFLNLVTVSHLKQNPTVKNEMKQKGFGDSVPAGFLCYPVSQAADILIMKSNIIPAGEDQKPMIEQANDIVDTFNRFYSPVFSHAKTVVGEVARLPGTDGNAKMSKSLGNCIYLSDSYDEIKTKVMSMYTDPNHIHVNDPGQVEGNVVFTYLDIFDPNTDEVEELKKQYQKGGLGDVVLKKRLIEVLENIIAPIREKRTQLASDMQTVSKILENGTNRARTIATQTMQEVKTAMKINYFN